MEYMQETIHTKIEGAYDVAVCGGGIAGIAAALAAAMTDDFTNLDVSRLQKTLERDGVVLHEDELTAPIQ